MSADFPRHLYDCGHCKFNWCCGPLCACFPGKQLPPAPYALGVAVERLQNTWRRSRAIGNAHWPAPPAKPKVETCDHCEGELAPGEEIIGCPDGREICQDCFDNGVG